jgi:hypothetical protein
MMIIILNRKVFKLTSSVGVLTPYVLIMKLKRVKLWSRLGSRLESRLGSRLESRPGPGVGEDGTGVWPAYFNLGDAYRGVWPAVLSLYLMNGTIGVGGIGSRISILAKLVEILQKQMALWTSGFINNAKISIKTRPGSTTVCIIHNE